jgi:hypothetical protein
VSVEPGPVRTHKLSERAFVPRTGCNKESGLWRCWLSNSHFAQPTVSSLICTFGERFEILEQSRFPHLLSALKYS